MSDIKARTSHEDKGKKSVKLISFVGGLVFVSVVTGVLLTNNARIRTEVEEQAEALLKTSREVINQIRFVVAKVGKITGEAKAAKKNSTISDEGEATKADDYDSLWRTAEAALK